MKTLKTSLLYQFVIATVSLGVSSSVCLGKDLNGGPQGSVSVNAEEPTDAPPPMNHEMLQENNSGADDTDSSDGGDDSEESSSGCAGGFCTIDFRDSGKLTQKVTDACKAKADRQECRGYRPDGIYEAQCIDCPQAKAQIKFERTNEKHQVCNWYNYGGGIPSECRPRPDLGRVIQERFKALCRKP